MNALCNLSRKKSREVAASLPGRFLSRRCFTLCITMEVEPRIAKQYTVAVAKIIGERDGEWRKKRKKSVFVSFFFFFFCSPEDCEFVEKIHPTAGATSYCLLPDTF